jgi:hypothetical protein
VVLFSKVVRRAFTPAIEILLFPSSLKHVNVLFSFKTKEVDYRIRIIILPQTKEPLNYLLQRQDTLHHQYRS